MQADLTVNGGNFTLDISGMSLPLVIKEGVILEGTYDPILNPFGTQITCTTRVNYTTAVKPMYMFVMKNGTLLNPTTIRKLNISGPSWHWQDYNAGPVAGSFAYVGGIFIDRPSSGYGQYHLIQDCELWGFSNSAIWSDVRTKDITIERCYIHHTKGYSYYGIGYGIWFKSAYATLNSAPDPAENLIVKNSMFDECKSAIDGQGFEYEWLINDCSFSQFMFVDDINGHDQSGESFNHSGVAGSTNCLFYDNYTDPLPAGVNTASPYTIDRIGGWRTIIQHSIFHRKVLVSSAFQSTSNVNIPYPNENEPNARIEITNNTFASQLYPQNTFDRNKGGFAAFSGNYSAECVWIPDLSYIISQPNKFSYLRNSTVNNVNEPQPPVFDFQLQDMNGNALAQNSNGVAVIDLNTNITGQFKVALNSGAPNQNLRYYLRTNPSEGVSNTTSNITQSIQNHFFSNQNTGMLSTTATIPFKYVDDNSTPNPLPGLFGLDMMAFHTNNNSGATYWSQLHASDWRYQPLIVVPKASTVSPNYIESQLVFHIKDSYQEFNKLTSGSTTGMKKQVRLNNNILWEEDIADGGDDWERIAIPYAVLHPFLNSNQSNTLSFHIASNPGVAISNTLVRGLIVWIDDIYFNKFDDAMGTNLITDGSVECADGYGDCNWDITDIYNSGCTPPAIAPPGAEEDFSYYPDGSRVTTLTGLSSKGDFSKTDRKSGQFALQLVLPFLPATCGNTNLPPDDYQSTNIDGKFITMKTDFVWYTPFCENYTNALVNSNAPSVQYYGNYNLNEDFILQPNQNVIFQNCSLAVAAGKQIRVQAGAHLILNNCVLFSCGAMWQGIVNEGGVVTVTATPNSIAKISDAVEAIRSDNGYEVNATSVIFSNNYVGISLNEGNYSTSDIIGCSFNPTSASEILKIPYNQTRTFAGIQLNSVSEFQLGSLTSTVFNPRNIFQYANYGVYSLNSDITFESNLFTDLMPGIDHCIDCGTGIYSEVNDGMTHSILIAGGTGSVTKNNFNVDVSHGIISNGPINLTISECIFNGNNYNSIKITKNRNSIVSIENSDFQNAGEKGISMYSNSSCDINILNNTFTDVVTGVFGQDFRDCSVAIGENSFDNSNVTEVIGANFHNAAITLQNSRAASNYSGFIWSNSISNCRIGIYVSNFNKIKIGMDPGSIIYSNVINFTLNSTPQIGIYYGGICLNHCADARIVNNQIANGTAINGTNLFRGIDIVTCTGSSINCNTVDKLPRSIYFTGDCSRTKMRSNNFFNYEHAVELFDANTILNDQGDWDATIQDWRPLYNEWIDDAIVSPFSRVFRNGIGINISWYHDGQPKHIPLPSNTVLPKLKNQSCFCDCNNFNLASDRDNSIGKVISDSISFESNISENTYSAKLNAYQALKTDSSLVYEGKPNDVIYESFLTAMDGGNMGLFDSINVLLSDSLQIAQAMALNNVVIDTNNVEYYLKTINEISLNTVEQNLPLSFTDSTTFNYISDQALATVGIAKFMAAAHLGKEVHENSTFFSNRTIGKPVLQAIHPINFVQVFPNPAYDKVTFKIHSDAELNLIIYDALGKIVFTATAFKNKYVFECSYLLPGLYRYQIVSDSFSEAGNFNIVR